MKGSRERNILIAVLSIAGLGLLIDRVIIGSDATTPAASSAGVIDSLTDDPSLLLITSSQADRTVAASAGNTSEAASLARRVREVTGAGPSDNAAPGRNAFVPPRNWLPTTGPNAETGLSNAAESFQRDYRLDAVLLTGDRRCAVVNGQMVYPGQSLQGYRLIAVHERSAEFEVDGERVTLAIRAGEPSP